MNHKLIISKSIGLRPNHTSPLFLPHHHNLWALPPQNCQADRNEGLAKARAPILDASEEISRNQIHGSKEGKDQ